MALFHALARCVPLALVCSLAGCAGDGGAGGRSVAPAVDDRTALVEDAVLHVDPASYRAAFEAARDALRDAGFSIERVDAAAGVITTAPMPALAAWKSGLLREAGVPQGASWTAGTVEARAEFRTHDETADLREAARPLTLRFEVVERREHRPSRRIDTTSVVYASAFSDREWSRQGLEPAFSVAARRNAAAEAALIRRTGEALSPQ